MGIPINKVDEKYTYNITSEKCMLKRSWNHGYTNK